MELVFTNCGVGYDEAGVICNTTLDQEVCNHTDVRLVNGNPPQEGEVEICLNGLWGSVCSNRWDVNDGKVVCRQLGYNGSSFSLLHRTPYRSFLSTIYHLDSVECRGNETMLVECNRKRPSNNCYSKSGVRCNSTLNLECNETDVRLVDGLTPHDGRVEICLNDVWGSVCNDLWDARDAQVVCRQLRYNGRTFFFPCYSQSIVHFHTTPQHLFYCCTLPL
ncbi:Egg peptide speract receptor [Geodia barretti]|uniref:Egg peptide speract receptor n=1 Tax=Geodia barretti TaxID=519541 RepID=A0AA35THI7_GEOBA|nr:Egg peptide speract receptor [Geodia barretti]